MACGLLHRLVVGMAVPIAGFEESPEGPEEEQYGENHVRPHRLEDERDHEADAEAARGRHAEGCHPIVALDEEVGLVVLVHVQIDDVESTGQDLQRACAAGRVELEDVKCGHRRKDEVVHEAGNGHH